MRQPIREAGWRTSPGTQRNGAGRAGMKESAALQELNRKRSRPMIEDIEKIQDEAAIQFKRIAQIQVQIDATLKALKDMGERAGRQRKKR
jgi:hypothetical protein